MQWFNRSLIAVIIGCLNILTYSIVCAVLIINLKYHQFSNYDYNEYDDVYESFKQRQETQSQRELYGSIYVAMCILMDIVSMLLIWGVMEKRPRFITPWILASFVVLVYSAIVVMDDIFMKSSFQGVANSTVFFCVLFAVFGFQIFCLALVYSLYKDIELDIKLRQLRYQSGQVDRAVSSHNCGKNVRHENHSDEEEHRSLQVSEHLSTGDHSHQRKLRTGSKTESKRNESKKSK